MYIGGRGKEEGKGLCLSLGGLPFCLLRGRGLAWGRGNNELCFINPKHATEPLPEPALLYYEVAIAVYPDAVGELCEHRKQRNLRVEAEIPKPPLHEGEGGLAIDCLAESLHTRRGIVQGEP